MTQIVLLLPIPTHYLLHTSDFKKLSFFFSTMIDQDCCFSDIPDWVASLADDHLTSLRLLFSRAEAMRSQVQAIQTHRTQGTLPGNLSLTFNVSSYSTTPLSSKALHSAESVARRGQEHVLMKIATARLQLSCSMTSTLRMMSHAAKVHGQTSLSQEEIEVYAKWFEKRLDAVILIERHQLRSNAAVRRGSSRRINTPMRAPAIIRAGQESNDATKFEK